MCNCQSMLEEKLKERFKSQTLDASRVDVTLMGYADRVDLTAGKIVPTCYMPILFEYDLPKKAGGFRRMKKKSSMHFTYCPFCGEKYNNEATCHDD